MDSQPCQQRPRGRRPLRRRAARGAVSTLELFVWLLTVLLIGVIAFNPFVGSVSGVVPQLAERFLGCVGGSAGCGPGASTHGPAVAARSSGDRALRSRRQAWSASELRQYHLEELQNANPSNAGTKDLSKLAIRLRELEYQGIVVNRDAYAEILSSTAKRERFARADLDAIKAPPNGMRRVFRGVTDLQGNLVLEEEEIAPPPRPRPPPDVSAKRLEAPAEPRFPSPADRKEPEKFPSGGTDFLPGDRALEGWWKDARTKPAENEHWVSYIRRVMANAMLEVKVPEHRPNRGETWAEWAARVRTPPRSPTRRP